ncbi:MAG: DUF2088 domain-containing protein [Sedimentibacter sp.]|nr:DUF2088 domain-containing protein [Sedimentibacter sp.]
MKKVAIEYGDGFMNIEVPESAVIYSMKTDHVDPKYAEDPVQEIKNALENPLGAKRIGDSVKPSDKVTICFPDRVKGGFHDKTHRKLSIPLILDELKEAGVGEKNIKFLNSTGLHRKNLKEEFESYMPVDVVNKFWGERFINHDSTLAGEMVYCGEDEFGDYVDINRHAFEADFTILLGHCNGNPYGGYSGGYKMAATGLTSYKSIRHHHSPGSLYMKDFLPISGHSHFRHQLRAIGKKMEEKMGREFFTVDSVIDTQARIIKTFAGRIDDVEKASWPIAAQRTEVNLDQSEKFDVVVVGIPRNFHYGPGMGSNPIQFMQAIGAVVSRCSDILSKDGVVIAASICDGWFNDEWFPYGRELYSLLQKCNGPWELARYEDDIANRPEYIYKYRYAYAYHPFHGFSMAYFGGIALQNTRAVYVIGAKEPGYARGMGCITKSTFEQALKDAEKYVGKDPKIFVLPDYLSSNPVHFFLKK